MVRGVLLDVDGTLIDSNAAHAASFQAALEQYGYKISANRILPLIGMGADKLLPELLGSVDDKTLKKIAERKLEIYLGDFFPSVPVFAGAKELVNRLRREGIPTAIASSADERELIPALSKIGISFLQENAVKSSEVENSKPDPDILACAAQKIGIPATECLLVGDTPYDIAAATKLDMPCIGLRCGGWSLEALSGAAEVFTGPAELLENWARVLMPGFAAPSASASPGMRLVR